MEDYKLQLKVQNGHLFRMMESRGLKSVAELSRATGINQMELGKAANLKKSAYTGGGKITSVYKNLCDFFYCDIADLVPEQHMMTPLLHNVTESFATKGQLEALTDGSINPSVIVDKAAISIDSILSNSNLLTDREQSVIKMRFEGEKTREYIGKKLGVTSVRISQIEAKALRKMRHPKYGLSEIMEVYREEALS